MSDAVGVQVAEAGPVRFVLRAPTAAVIAHDGAACFTLVSFGAGRAELSVGARPTEAVSLRAGAVLTAPARTSLVLRPRDAFESLALLVDPAHGDATLNWPEAGVARGLIEAPDAGLLAVAQEIRRALLGDPLLDPRYLGALGEAILARLAQRLEEREERSLHSLAPGLIARVVRHVDAQLGKPLKVEELAEIAGLSRSHFSRAFQRVTGDPPQRFILKRRVCRARDLISAGGKSLGEIAAEVGFSSQAHMTKAFRDELGVTPSRYRDAFQAGDDAEPK